MQVPSWLETVPQQRRTEAMTDANLDEAVTSVRELVAADGGGLDLVSYTDGHATLALRLDTAECRECVMPSQFLAQVALDLMAAHLPDLTEVTINDPRDATP